MKPNLKWLALALLAVVAIPLGTVYRQNVEELSAEMGVNRLLVEAMHGAVGSPMFGILLGVFVFTAGAASTLWIQSWLSKDDEILDFCLLTYDPRAPGIFQCEVGVEQAHLLVGRDSEFSIVFDFTGRIETPYIYLTGDKSGAQWMERFVSEQMAILTLRGEAMNTKIRIMVASEKWIRADDKRKWAKRQHRATWQPVALTDQ